MKFSGLNFRIFNQISADRQQSASPNLIEVEHSIRGCSIFCIVFKACEIYCLLTVSVIEENLYAVVVHMNIINCLKYRTVHNCFFVSFLTSIIYYKYINCY